MAEVLKLSTLIERPTIIIDDVSYEIMSPDELSVVETYRLASQGKRIEQLMDSPKLEAVDERELAGLIRGIADFLMVGVPVDVRDKLTDAMRTEVAEVFTTLPLRKHMKALGKEIDATEAATKTTLEALTKTKSKPIGAKSRDGSKGSTAGNQDGGSTMPK